jgi:hypothetical protein
MLIADIGEIIDHYKELQRLDRLIEEAKSGKILVHVGGANQGEDLAEACQVSVVNYLRALRGVHARALLQHGFTE